MQRIWNDIRTHAPASAVFLTGWLAVNFLYLYHPDDARLQLQFVPPVIAGSLVCWWRRHGPERITGGTLAGATVLFIDVALFAARESIVALMRGKGVLRALDDEFVLVAIIAAVLGAALGFLGAVGTVVLARLSGEWRTGSPLPPDVAGMPVAERPVMPRRMLWMACGLVLAVAAMLAPDQFGRSKPPFVSTVNVLIAVVLLAPVSRWSADTGKALVILAGLVSVSIASLLLAGAFSRWVQGPQILAIALFFCTIAELGAGVLTLIAAFRAREA